MKNLFILFAVIVFFAACTKEVQYSNIPQITFNSFVHYKDVAGKDTALDFIFDLKDGDGDIGVIDGQIDNSCGADNNNLYVKYEEKRDTAFYPKKLWQQVTNITTNCDTTIYFDSVQVQFNQRMQYVSPATNKKSIEARVTYHMDYYSSLILFSAAGRFNFHIRDRAGHVSNTVITPELDLVK